MYVQLPAYVHTIGYPMEAGLPYGSWITLCKRVDGLGQLGTKKGGAVGFVAIKNLRKPKTLLLTRHFPSVSVSRLFQLIGRFCPH
jgi:hypothetical protein